MTAYRAGIFVTEGSRSVVAPLGGEGVYSLQVRARRVSGTSAAWAGDVTLTDGDGRVLETRQSEEGGDTHRVQFYSLDGLHHLSGWVKLTFGAHYDGDSWAVEIITTQRSDRPVRPLDLEA